MFFARNFQITTTVYPRLNMTRRVFNLLYIYIHTNIIHTYIHTYIHISIPVLGCEVVPANSGDDMQLDVMDAVSNTVWIFVRFFFVHVCDFRVVLWFLWVFS